MNLRTHTLFEKHVAEVLDEDVLIRVEGDVIPLFEELYPSQAHAVILHKAQCDDTFFDLRTGLAGAVLQKFSNYRIQLAIVGDFSQVTSKSLNAFIYESNKGEQIFFVDSLEAALQRLS
jgi:hypothetical protein